MRHIGAESGFALAGGWVYFFGFSEAWAGFFEGDFVEAAFGFVEAAIEARKLVFGEWVDTFAGFNLADTFIIGLHIIGKCAVERFKRQGRIGRFQFHILHVMSLQRLIKQHRLRCISRQN